MLKFHAQLVQRVKECFAGINNIFEFAAVPHFKSHSGQEKELPLFRGGNFTCWQFDIPKLCWQLQLVVSVAKSFGGNVHKSANDTLTMGATASRRRHPRREALHPPPKKI